MIVSQLKPGDRFSFVPAAWHGPSVVVSSHPSGETWKLTFDNPKIVNPPGLQYLDPHTKVRLMPLKPKAKTGWVAYWVSGKGGQGYKEWKYFYSPGLCFEGNDDPEGILDYVMRNFETWALYAERVSYGIETDAKPPRKEIEKAIAVAKRNAKYYRDEAKALTAQLEKL